MKSGLVAVVTQGHGARGYLVLYVKRRWYPIQILQHAVQALVQPRGQPVAQHHNPLQLG